ncbi:MAG: ATP-binding protein [bacterium]
MFPREFWITKIQEAWRLRSIIWLVGVRRIGKTTLVKSLSEGHKAGKNAKNGIEHQSLLYYDCELKRNRDLIESDVEKFWEEKENQIVILDEIHRLENPSEVLKIAADHYPKVKVIATGSSNLAASKKFKDTLSGRKIVIELRPLIEADLHAFTHNKNIKKNPRIEDDKNAEIRVSLHAHNAVLEKRFLYGGMPENYLNDELPEYAFEEWIDSYWSKDIQELYELRSKFAFQKFMELLFIQSGGIFEASKFATDCKVSSPTISNFLHVLEETFVIDVLRPYHKRKNSEIVSAPKVYAFDTGLACYLKGWSSLRNEDLGILWEHFVLNEFKAHLQNNADILYWRNKKKQEVDFIIKKKRSQTVIAIETKWQAKNFSPDNLQAFRELHPEGENFLIANDIQESYTKNYTNLKVKFISLKEFFNFPI